MTCNEEEKRWKKCLKQHDVAFERPLTRENRVEYFSKVFLFQNIEQPTSIFHDGEKVFRRNSLNNFLQKARLRDCIRASSMTFSLRAPVQSSAHVFSCFLMSLQRSFVLLHLHPRHPRCGTFLLTYEVCVFLHGIQLAGSRWHKAGWVGQFRTMYGPQRGGPARSFGRNLDWIFRSPKRRLTREYDQPIPIPIPIWILTQASKFSSVLARSSEQAISPAALANRLRVFPVTAIIDSTTNWESYKGTRKRQQTRMKWSDILCCTILSTDNCFIHGFLLSLDNSVNNFELLPLYNQDASRLRKQFPGFEKLFPLFEDFKV